MFFRYTSWEVPASADDIDTADAVAKISSLVVNQSDVVAVCSFDGTSVTPIQKDASAIEPAVRAIMTAGVNGSTQNMSAWTFLIGAENNVFLFYRIM